MILDQVALRLHDSITVVFLASEEPPCAMPWPPTTDRPSPKINRFSAGSVGGQAALLTPSVMTEAHD